MPKSEEALRSALVADDGLTTTATVSADQYFFDDTLLPGAYRVIASGGPLPFTVILEVEAMSGFPECRGIHITAAQGQPSITNATLRLPIARILRQSAQQAAGRRTSLSIKDGQWRATAEPTPDEWQPKRRLRVDEDRLRQAAQAWRSVKGLPRALEEMGKRLHVERSQAARLRSAAVSLGYLRADEVPTRNPKERP